MKIMKAKTHATHKAFAILGITLCGLVTSDSARAEAPPETDSDRTTTVLEDVIELDSLKVQPHHAKAQVGAYYRSDDRQGLDLAMTAGKRLALTRIYKGPPQASNLFVINAKVDAKLKLLEDGEQLLPQAFHFESPSFELIEAVNTEGKEVGPDGERVIHSTSRGAVLQFQYSKNQDQAVSKDIQGLEFTPANGSFHIARKVGKVPFELCGAIEVLQFTIGKAQVDIEEQEAAFTPVDVMGCAAVSAGPIRLSNETSFKHTSIIDGVENRPNATATEFSTDTNLNFVTQRKHKVGVYHSFQIDSSQNRGELNPARNHEAQVRTHTFGARVAF